MQLLQHNAVARAVDTRAQVLHPRDVKASLKQRFQTARRNRMKAKDDGSADNYWKWTIGFRRCGNKKFADLPEEAQDELRRLRVGSPFAYAVPGRDDPEKSTCACGQAADTLEHEITECPLAESSRTAFREAARLRADTRLSVELLAPFPHEFHRCFLAPRLAAGQHKLSSALKRVSAVTSQEKEDIARDCEDASGSGGKVQPILTQKELDALTSGSEQLPAPPAAPQAASSGLFRWSLQDRIGELQRVRRSQHRRRAESAPR